MEEKDDKTLFAREPWQRLLAGDDDGPPETTDARIRAAARRDLAPRGHRWWLPASLAASFVLAVFVVQSQFGTVRVPVANESDDGAGGAINARIIDREEAQEARPPGASPSAPGKRAAEPRNDAEADDYGYPDSELAADSAGTGPMVGGPERELKAASEPPQESFTASAPEAALATPSPPPKSADENAKDLGKVVVTGSRKRNEEIAVTGSGTRTQAISETPPAATMIRPPPFEKTPDIWYAYIKKLRAQGKAEEAERQLARLERAHPGWLERYLEASPER